MEEAKTNRKYKSRRSTSRGNASASRGLDTPSSGRGVINHASTACHPSGRWEIPSTFGEFHTSFSYRDIPKNFNLLKRANELRKAGFFHEMILWKKLKCKQMCGLSFHRQQVIGNYIVDFVCYKIRLIIEADGASHKGKEEYDKRRDIYLKNSGFNILHIPVKDIFQNLNKVIKKIKAHIEAHPLSQRGAEPLRRGGVS
jgi:very-short-patch-repair endonuclease